MLIPYGTSRPCRRIPYATYTLLGLNTLIYLLHVFVIEQDGWFFVPAHFSPITWVAAMFTHGDISHLLGNMLFLWLFGTLTEDVLGPWLFLAFYFGGHAGASGLDALVSYLFVPANLNTPVIGASGAIAGIMGLSAVCFTRTKVNVWYLIWFRPGTFSIGAPAFLGLWVVWELFQGLFWTSVQMSTSIHGGVAHWAHIGGFAVGMGWALADGLNKSILRSDLVSGRKERVEVSEAYSQIADLEELVVKSPQDAEAWYALARQWEVNGQEKNAVKNYEKALVLFLQHRRFPNAVKAYQGMAAHGGIPQIPTTLYFEFACAMEQAGKYREAYQFFRQIAFDNPTSIEAETAFLRAGDIARIHLQDKEAALQCYDRFLQEFPFSNWHAQVEQRKKELQG